MVRATRSSAAPARSSPSARGPAADQSAPPLPTPSTRQWWVFQPSAQCPPSRPSTSTISHSGRVRSSGREKNSAVQSLSCPSSPGARQLRHGRRGGECRSAHRAPSAATPSSPSERSTAAASSAEAQPAARPGAPARPRQSEHRHPPADRTPSRRRCSSTPPRPAPQAGETSRRAPSACLTRVEANGRAPSR